MGPKRVAGGIGERSLRRSRDSPGKGYVVDDGTGVPRNGRVGSHHTRDGEFKRRTSWLQALHWRARPQGCWGLKRG